MSLRRSFLLLFGVLFVLISAAGGLIWMVIRNEDAAIRAEVLRYDSYKLADELRQSSDDLTRMARTYVVTGDEQYAAYFQEILDIRDGLAPRPLDYASIYWDLVLATGRRPQQAGEAVALITLMERAGFQGDELALLERAKQRSDGLARLETRAMNAVRGLYEDSTGAYTVRRAPDMGMAREILHGGEYHRIKGAIMEPIGEFLRAVESRTAADVAARRTVTSRLLLATIGLALVGMALLLVTLVLLARSGTRAFGETTPAEQFNTGVHQAVARERTTLAEVWPILAATVVAIAAVSLGGWASIARLRDTNMTRLGQTLLSTHDNALKGARQWLGTQVQGAIAWSQDTELQDALRTNRSSGHPALADLPGKVAGRNWADFVLLRPDNSVFAVGGTAGRQARLPSTFLDAVAVGPQYAALAMPSAGTDSTSRQPWLLVGAVVRDRDGRLLGKLVFLIDPARGFSEQLATGRIRQSDESYAVNASGELLTGSRFEGVLRAAGRLGADQGSVLAIAARTPGGEPTLALQQVLAGRTGSDLEGYVGYWGTPVLGAWTWDEALGLGVITELGQEEATASYLASRRTILQAVAGIMLLLLSLTGLFLRSRIRVARDQAALRALVGQVQRQAEDLKVANVEIAKSRQRMEDELNVGREIQMSMLPLIFPPYPRRSEFAIYGTLIPAREVGGDFYDFYLPEEDRLCFVVGDVSGKGVPAALFMAVTKTLIESRARFDPSPASIMTHVNSELSRNNKASMFVTIFLAILDVKTGVFRYTNAGHNPPFILRTNGAVERLGQRHGPIIGAIETMVYREDEAQLARGDRVVAYTDGVTEAMNPENALYGEPALAEALGPLVAQPIQEVIEGVVRSVRSFERGADQADDITVLGVEYRGGREEEVGQRFHLVLTNQLEEIARLITAFNAFADQHALPKAVRRTANLVFDELVNNIISYAFVDDAAHDIEVTAELTPNRLIITLSDDGVPFNIFQQEPPDTALSIEEREIGGLGVHLVRRMMDEVSYRRTTGRNVVTLIKYLTDEASA